MSKSQKQAISKTTNPARTTGTRFFLWFLGGIATIYGVILALHLAFPRKQTVDADSYLERCRELCLSYGLVPTGHVANDAKAYLDAAKPQTLSVPLNDLLSDPNFTPVDSQSHPLLGQLAPEIQLEDDRHQRVSLTELLKKGPVIVVFYFGYGCSHCVAQLFGLQKDLAHFRALGAQVIAVSPDSSEHTAKRLAEYGRFDFPLVSDSDNAVATAWSVYTGEAGDKQEDRQHGTFIIDHSGRVIFADRGYKPFLDNKSLLLRLADRATNHTTAD